MLNEKIRLLIGYSKREHKRMKKCDPTYSIVDSILLTEVDKIGFDREDFNFYPIGEGNKLGREANFKNGTLLIYRFLGDLPGRDIREYEIICDNQELLSGDYEEVFEKIIDKRTFRKMGELNKWK